MEKTVNVSPEIFEDDKIRYLFTFRKGDVGSKSSYLAGVLYRIGKDYENSF